MKYEPSGPFIISILELMKLDVNTMFEWQRHSQAQTRVPHYQDLLDFLDLQAQASEMPLSTSSKRLPIPPTRKPLTSSKLVDSSNNQYVLCNTGRHLLYVCPKFESISHDKVSTLKGNDLCMNCLSRGHFVKQCRSLYWCRKCQKPHHTLLHMEVQNDTHLH